MNDQKAIDVYSGNQTHGLFSFEFHRIKKKN